MLKSALPIEHVFGQDRVNNNLALFSVLRDELQKLQSYLPARLLPDISAAHRRIRMASKVLTLRATPFSTISTGRPKRRSIISTVDTGAGLRFLGPAFPDCPCFHRFSIGG